MTEDRLVGQTIQGYRLIRKLGRGGMASVYLAQDPKLEREVALKVLHGVDASDEIAAARFRQEALSTARLEHPNIVHIYDFGWESGLTFMVMEYCPNGTLDDMLQGLAARRQSMDPSQAVQIVTPIALALDFAHRSGIIHRDVKPSNILFAREGRPVLADMGIAKALEGPALTRSLTAVGTPEYMSPEQARGQGVDYRTDLYSLSIVLYEMLAGDPPFEGNTPWSIIHQHMVEPPPPLRSRNPQVSAPLALAIEKGLAKEPGERYQSGKEMAQAWTAALKEPTAAGAAYRPTVAVPAGDGRMWTPPPPPAQAGGRGRRSSKWVAILLAALALLAAGLVAAYLLDVPGRLQNPSPEEAAAVAAATATDPVPDAQPADTPRPTDTTPASAPAAATEVEQPATAAPATPTRPPTSTSVPTRTRPPTPRPTATPLRPTSTARPPTVTPAPPTVTPRPATATPARPGVVLDFEQLGRWDRGDQPYGALTASDEQVRDGQSAAKLAYDLPDVDDNYVVFLKQLPAQIAGEPSSLNLWVYGDGAGRFLNVWLQDREGEVRQFSFGKVQHSGWQQMSAPLDTTAPWPQTHISGPDNGALDFPASLFALVLDGEGSPPGQGVIYLDELTVGGAAASGGAATAGGSSGSAAAAPAATPATAPAAATGRIVYASGGGTLMAVDAASGATWTLAGNARQPAVRGDGRVLANGTGGGRENLFTAAITGGDERVIGLHPEDSYPDWSPSGASAVFWSTIGDGRERIYVQWNAGTTEEPARFKLGNTDIYGRNPTWLADGRIAFSGCNYWDTGSNCGIWAINSDGSGPPVQITDRPGDVSNDSRGNTLLFSSQRVGNWEVYAVAAGGGAARNLTDSSSQDAGAAFSPDGSTVAFISDRNGGWGIWTMQADGSNPRKLLAVAGGFGGDWPNERLAWE